MTINAGSLSLILSILSSIAPGTWALVAGILGLLFGFFGKQILKHYDRSARSKHSGASGKVPRRNSSRRSSNSSPSQKSSSSGRS